jgi:hypothetical protein
MTSQWGVSECAKNFYNNHNQHQSARRKHVAHSGIRPRLADRLSDQPASARGVVHLVYLCLPGHTGTNGCVALGEPQLEAVQDFSREGAVLAILPRQAIERFKGCLPDAGQR